METLYVKDFLNGGTLDKKELSRQLTVLNHVPGVYILENIINSKKYVGSSKDLKKRVYNHITKLFKQSHQNILLNNSVKKHGLAAFEVHFFETSDYVSLEETFLSYLRPEDLSINRNYSGGDLISNHPQRDKIIEKISASVAEKYKDPEYLKNHIESRLGEKNSNYKGGISYPRCDWPQKPQRSNTGENNSFYGKTHTLETKKSISERNKGKVPPNKGATVMNSPTSKKVQCGDKCFYSLNQAAIFLGRDSHWIERRIKIYDDWFFV